MKDIQYEIGKDEPGRIYKKHRHEATLLVTLKGSIRISVAGAEFKDCGPGDFLQVPANTDHEAIVGPNGWEYIAVWDEEEAKLYPEVDHEADSTV